MFKHGMLEGPQFQRLWIGQAIEMLFDGKSSGANRPALATDYAAKPAPRRVRKAR
jgi:hypothetical protein